MKLTKRQSKATPGDYSLTILPLARAKLALRVATSNTSMDDVITDLINAGVQFIESGLDYSIDTSGLITQYYDGFEETYLPIWHRHIVTTDLVVEYWNDSTWATVTASNYRLDLTSTPPKVFLTSTGEWPDDISDDLNSVRVSFKMDTTHSFLDDIKAAVMTYVAWKFENAEGSTEVPAGLMATINRHRMYS